MISRMLQILLGVVLFFGSTQAGMAKEAIQPETRADFFVADEVIEEDDRQMALSIQDVSLLPIAEGVAEGESSVESEEEAKRTQKRHSSHKTILSKCRFSIPLSQEVMARGVARNPQSQDARQERTALIRFLHQAALAC